MALLFKNAHVIHSDRIEPGCDLRVSGSHIVAVASGLKPERDDEVIDLSGQYLSPGFIDIHIHGAMGRDTMEATPEAFQAICQHHASGGTTALLLTTICAKTGDLTNVLRVARSYREATHDGAALLGIHLEGPYFSPAKPGAHATSLLREPSPSHYAPLLEYKDVLKQMTLAPELPGALELIDTLRSNGIRVSGGHSDAWDDQACTAFVHGMEGVTHTFNCMSSARRRGVYRVAGLLEFAMSEPGILCELIADGHHVSPTLMKMLYLAKGADGICLVTDATSGAGLADGSEFRLGEIDCVVRDGVALTADGESLAGSTADMSRLVRTMVEHVQVSLVEAVRMATLVPAKALQLERKGVLAAGADADLVVLDQSLQVQATYVEGRKVYQRNRV